MIVPVTHLEGCNRRPVLGGAFFSELRMCGGRCTLGLRLLPKLRLEGFRIGSKS